MKKLILLLLLIPLPLFASLHTWTSSEFEVFEFENTTVGDWNSNTMTKQGTGGLFDYTGITAKWDSHSYYPISGNKNDYISQSTSSLYNNMKNASAWTIEYWIWYPTKDTGAAGISKAVSLGSILNVHVLTSTWNPWGANMNFVYSGGNHFLGTFSATNYTNGTANAWNRITITWDGNYIRLYINGTLTYTSGAGQANLFVSSGILYTNASPDYSSYYNYGMDRLIFHNGDTGGAEITPVPPTTPTFTITQTITQTITKTITPTVTQTITPTITPTYTVTQTITQTVTQTVTQTSTPFVCTPGSVPMADWLYLTGTSHSTNDPGWPIDDPGVYYSRDRGEATWWNSNLWIAGGTRQDNIFLSDVWSSPEGITWFEKTDDFTSGIGDRALFGFIGFGGYLWIINGYSFDATNTIDDVWNSPDGATWTRQAASTALSGRWGFSVLEFNSKLWVLGGGSGNPNTSFSQYPNPNNEYVSTDGINWDKPAPYYHAEFGGRMWTYALVFKGSMWLIGGFDGAINYNDVWRSDNTGINWVQTTVNMGTGVFPSAVWSDANFMYVYAINSGTGYEIYRSDDGITWLPTDETQPPPQQRIQGAYAQDNTVPNHGVMYLLSGYWNPPIGYPGYDTDDVWQWSIRCLVPTATFTITSTSTVTPTVTKTITPTITPTKTPRLTFTSTITPSFTPTITATPTFTVTRIITLRPTYTQTLTFTFTGTPSRTSTRTVTPNYTSTDTPTRTITPHLVTFTSTITPYFIATHTLTQTPTQLYIFMPYPTQTATAYVFIRCKKNALAVTYQTINKYTNITQNFDSSLNISADSNYFVLPTDRNDSVWGQVIGIRAITVLGINLGQLPLETYTGAEAVQYATENK